jgi:2-oxoglutarate dehydrogenase E2 component (dihydrolipoamide succinyltransferase)
MPVNIIIPSAGESVTSGVLSRWLKKPGDFVKRDEPVLELETDKVNLEVPAPAAGVLSATAKAGDTVQIGQVVGAIDEKASAPASAPAAAPVAAVPAAAPVAAAVAAPAAVGAPVAPAPAPVAAHAQGDDDVRATPLARKLAEELHVDLSRLHGTGAGGRVREQDVLAAAHAGAPASTNGVATPAAAAPARATSRERMSPLRQRIAQRLVQAQHTAAMLTTFNECDMSAVMDLRKAYKEEFEKKHAIGLGFMGFFVKAATAALKAFPLVNASIVEDEQGNPTIEKHEYCDIAMAVSTPKGLTVPVLRGCERLTLAQIEKGIKDLATKARDGKITLEDLQGGTFTITNGGIFGSLMSTPILNPPQSAILGMHAIKNRAVEHPVGSGQVAIRPMMYLALSYDHRIIDGAEAVQFLVRIKQAIEDPQRLLLEI